MSICVIPARGDSRRIPRKNLRPFFGKPIIAYSIETARESGLFERIVVSTDDDEIARVAERYGAEPVIRPAEFCRDEVGTQEVFAFVLEQLDWRELTACCIYATAPLMIAEDLRDGLSALNIQGAEFSMSVGARPLRDAGQWYWGRTINIMNQDELIAPWTAMVPIPEERVCDINTEADWLRAEDMYRKLHPEVA